MAILNIFAKIQRMSSTSEENYLKTIFKLTRSKKSATTNRIGELLNTKASSVTDMIKKLSKKGLVDYTKYQGVSLTVSGQKEALMIIRKHRLWECFLHDSLGFAWDEVHAIAEELEHIDSAELINRLDRYMGFPKHDPHGDPIPDKDGNLTPLKNLFISDLKVGELALVTGIKDTSKDFLIYLKKIKLILGTSIEVLEKISFDQSVKIRINGSVELNISDQIGTNVYVKQR